MNIVYTAADVTAPANAICIDVERFNGASIVEIIFKTEQEAIDYSVQLEMEFPLLEIGYDWVDLSTDVEAEGWAVMYTVDDDDCTPEPDYNAEFEQYVESRMSCYGY